jgi:hypothetical protein
MFGAAQAARFIQNSEFKIQHFFLFHRVTPGAIAADHEDLRPRDQRCVFFIYARGACKKDGFHAFVN